MGDLAGSVLGSDKKETTGGDWSSNAWTPELNKLYQQMIGEVQTGGAPQGPGHLGLNQMQTDALGQLGLGGTSGKYYQDLLSGQGQADRYAGLQTMNQASADLANQTLGSTLNQVQSASGAAGQAGSSRSGIASGLAGAQSQASLAAIQAQQNQAFQQNEQALMGNAANQLQGIAGQQFGAGAVLQQDDLDKLLTDYDKQFGQTSAGKLGFLSNFANSISGIAGGTQTGGSKFKQGAFNPFKAF